jgi:hypothetical protein
MARVFEFLILIFCIAVACGIVAWTVRCENKTNNKQRKEKKDDN